MFDVRSKMLLQRTFDYFVPVRTEHEDLRNDIYSLGATLFHAVSGQPPIKATTNSATELRELKQHPLELRGIAPHVSPATARALQHMIAPDATQRFSSYDDLIAELDAVRRALEIASAHRAGLLLDSFGISESSEQTSRVRVRP